MTTRRGVPFHALKMIMMMATAVFIFIIGTLTTLSASTTQGSNAVPQLITYQGYLTDDAGEPLTGTADLTFGIYAELTGGDALWSEIQTDVPLSDGYFTVMLGSVTPLSAETFSDAGRYLQVGVDRGDGVVDLPRQQLTAVPYAFRAQEAANAWSLNGNSGIDPTMHKLGTTDGMSLTLVMSDTAVWRFDTAVNPVGDFAPNIIANPFSNTVQADTSGVVIAGGTGNEIANVYSTISGGANNSATGDAAVVGGGYENEATEDFATVGGGINNGASGYLATVGGGAGNIITGSYGTVGGGFISKVGADYAVVGGGYRNEIGGGGKYAVVGGGYGNNAEEYGSTVGGGMSNSVTGNYAAVSGGSHNDATGSYATVGGGSYNEATGRNATVGGGNNNKAVGDYSYAAGRYAQANHDGSFVWLDGSSSVFASTGANQFLVEADGGMGVGTNAPVTQLHVVAARDGVANMADHVMAVENNSVSVDNGPDVLALKVSNQSDPDGGTNYITFADQDGGVGAVEGNGSGGVTYKTSGADFAEYLPLEDPSEIIEPGMVVGLSQGRISQRTAGAEQVFVVSSAAGFVGNAMGDDQAEGMVLVALMGQVTVQVRGGVQAGDYIVASGLDDGFGVAVSLAALRADQVGQVAGVALETAVAGGRVLVLVGMPHDTIWQALLEVRDVQLADMEVRLAQLEEILLAESEDAGCESGGSHGCP